MVEITREQTALHIAGGEYNFWLALALFAPNCYDSVAAEYDAIQDLEPTDGIDNDGDPIDVSDYPMRQRPNTRPS